MTWWLEGATSRHFGWVRNPSEAIFSYFWSQGKNREKNQKFREKSDFSEKSAIFSDFFKFRFFIPKIVSNPTENRFFAEKSAQKNDFLVLGWKTVCMAKEKGGLGI